MIRQFKEAQETKKGIVKDFKLKVYADFDADRAVWLQAVKAMAELDCLFSLAKSSSSMGQPSCRPEFVESNEAFIDFEELRHPAIATRDSFIPNDIKLGGNSERVMLLTGPNMGE
jgi:DNA mismatch repair protein MSH6